MANYQYLVTAPERWDSVAYKAYGDVGMIGRIVGDNPEVLISAEIPAGTVLNIPIVSEDQQAISTASLPPWFQ